MEHRGFGRGKLYPDLFEGVCGVVCAQRIAFQRVYGMMESLARTFGGRLQIDGQDYWAFPRPRDLSGRTEEDVRACGLGFRARYVLGIAKAMASDPVPYTAWRQNGEAALRERLLTLPGIGPYTADLSIAVVYGRTVQPHVDSYVRSVISTLYFGGEEQDDAAVAAFIAKRWGSASEQVLDLLTTDTQTWATPLGYRLSVRSGARGKR
jgi:N-glycosylase/DNA lyase